MNPILAWIPALIAMIVASTGAWLLWRRVARILRSKIELEAVFDHVDPMAVLDPGRRIVRANLAFLRLFSPKDSYRSLLGRFAAEVLDGLWPGDDPVEAVLADGSRRSLHDIPWAQGGEPRFADLHFYPVEHPLEARVASVVVHIQDVTELAAARRQAAEAATLLREANGELVERNEELRRVSDSLTQAYDAIHAEIEIAKEIQEGILPKTLPQVDGARFFASYSPISQVGGDLYDFLQLDDHRIGIFVADVSGHGLPAAFEGAMVKMSFLNHGARETSPAQLFHALNNDLIRNLAVGHYVTAFYGILDLVDNSLTFCRASHPRPVLLRADGTVEYLGSHGLFVGIVEDPGYEDVRIELHEGDRLCIFTDGYYEIASRDGRRLGYENLTRILCETRAQTLQESHGAIEGEIAAFTDHVGDADDRTFVGIDVTGPSRRERFRLALRFTPGAPFEAGSFSTIDEGWILLEQFLSSLQQASWPDKEIRKVQLAASELCMNAVVHGLRNRPGECAWAAWNADARRCMFAVSDPGPGFDPDSLPDPRHPTRRTLEHGRGIFLARRNVQRIWFDHGGATITFRHDLR